MSTKSFRGKNMTAFSGFRGVDFSSSPLDVDVRRASEMENFISDFGILKKRNGWRQEREFTDGNGNRLPVCGVFPYKYGEITHVLIHAGDRFLRLTENGYERIDEGLSGICATRSEAYMQKGRLYIVGCGDFLVYGTWDEGKTYKLQRVYDEAGDRTYIPVTTINIGASEGDVSAILDGVNLLTPWRKNRLNGLPFYQEDVEGSLSTKLKGDTYYLDAPIKIGTKVTVKIIEENVELSYTLEQGKVFTGTNGTFAGHRHIDKEGNISMVFSNENDVPKNEFTISYESGTGFKCKDGTIGTGLIPEGTYTVDGKTLTISPRTLDSVLYRLNLNVGGYTVDTRIQLGFQLYRSQDNGGKLGVRADIRYIDGRVKFDTGGTNRIDSVVAYGDGEDVFEVTFCAEMAEEEDTVPYPERIKNCSFGTLFGVDGASDRLFLTGNPLLPNTEFYSEADDFTYFPDVNTVQLGSDSIPIVGYLRLSDGTLAIFKEKRDVGDATIYYRTSYYKQYNATDGGLERIDAVFPTVAGNSGEAMLSRHAAKDFGGDKLFLSENGVFGVVVSQNITVGERYTRERSRTVNARLTGERGLSDAVSIVYKDKLWLAVNGNVYVADARYRSTRADNMDSAWGYEWYFLSNVPANVFCAMDGVLWFGTKDGRLCRFDNEYSDRTYSLFGSGEITLSGSKDGFFQSLTANTQRDPFFAPGDTFTTNDELFGVILSGFVRVDGPRIYHGDIETLAQLAEGQRVRLCRKGASFPEADIYEVRDIDLYEGCFSLYKEGAPVAFGNTDFSLLRELRGLPLDVISVEGSSVVLGLYGEAMKLVGPPGITGRLWHREPVKARWVSAVTDLGASMVGKSLHRLSITCEPTVHGRVSFGYNTRMSSLRRDSVGGAPFSLEALDFRSFSFETGFASSYSVRIFERQVNYLALAVESSEDTACAFNRLELLWSFGGYLSGVK